MNKKALTEKLVSIKADMNAILNSAKAQERELNNEEIAKFDELDAQRKNIEATIQRCDQMADTEDVVEERNDNQTAEQRDYHEFANTIRGIVAESRANNMTTTDNTAVIPETIAQKIIDKLVEISPVYARATRYTAKGTLVIPVVDAESTDITAGYQEEFTELASNSNKFKTISLKGFLAGALTKVSKSLLNNSDFDLVNFVINRMAMKFKSFMEKELIVGNSLKVKGIVESYDKTNMKITLAKQSTITSDELIDLQDKVIDAYQGDACWIMNRATRNAIRKLKDGQGNYLLNKTFGEKWNYELLGKPVFTSDNMNKLGEKSKPCIVYGDLSGLAVKEAEQLEAQILRERFATEHAIGVVGWVEFDAQVENTQKIAVAVTGGSDA